MTREGSDPQLSRRGYLGLAGTAAATALLAGCSALEDGETETESPTQTETRTGPTETRTEESPDPTDPQAYDVPFETVVDVTEVGADPNGTEPIDGIIDEHAADGTLLYFPSGTYRLEEGKHFPSFSNLGFAGDDATIVPPDQYNRYMFVFGTEEPGNASGLVFEGITFDFRAENTGPFALNVLVDEEVYVRDIAVRGQQDADQPVLGIAMMAEGGYGLVERADLSDGGPAGTQPVGIFVHRFHLGEVTFRDCRVEGFPNNGIYASRGKGPVKVEGGRYRNNDISQVRLSSAGSYAKDVDIVLDGYREDDRNQRGLWLKDPDGVLVENCRVQVDESLGIAVDVTGGRAATIRDTDLEINTSRYAFYIKEKTSNRDGNVLLENVSITGSATGDRIQYAINCLRDGTVFRNVTLDQTGEARSGLLLRAKNCLVENGSWVTSRHPFAVSLTQGLSFESCFLRLAGIEELAATGVQNPGSVLELSSEPDAEFGSGQRPTYCVGQDVLSRLIDGSGDSLVVINGLNQDGVVGRVVEES